MVEQPSPEGGRETVEGTWQDRPARFFTGRLIVKLRPAADEAVEGIAAGIAAELPAGQVIRPPGPTRRVVLALDPGKDVVEAAAEMSARDDVEYAEPDIVDHAALTPNDTRLSEQWSLPKVRAFDAWDNETGDPTVVIGIVDSGISMTGNSLDHPDLNDSSRIVLGTDFVDGGTPRDLNGHGTHVAGIAAGAGNNGQGIAGLAWGTRVYICRTLDANGNGSAADFADAVEEIVDYAVANNMKAVINYSGGGAASQTKLDACNYVNAHGMMLCAAAGNDSRGPVIFPAAYAATVTGVVAVGSTDSNDTVSSFSNAGPELTLVAPGGSILSSMPTYPVTLTAGLNYGYLSGTSMATPLVTGLVGLMWSRHPAFTNQQIRDCLTSTAVKLGAGTFDNTWGNGRVDADAAVLCGDIIVRPTIIGPNCPPSRLLASCPSRLVRCPPSQLVRCPPSRPPVLCPPSRVQVCPSRLPNLCPTTKVPVTCPVPSQIECPIPSRVQCPGPGPGPGPGPVEGLAAQQGEMWYGEGGDYYWVDDAGVAHPFEPGESASAEAVADYYWIDDEGRLRLWSPGTGGDA